MEPASNPCPLASQDGWEETAEKEGQKKRIELEGASQVPRLASRWCHRSARLSPLASLQPGPGPSRSAQRPASAWMMFVEAGKTGSRVFIESQTLELTDPDWTDSARFSSVAQSCPTLCDPMDCSTPGLPVHHQLPELTQTHVH